MQILDYVAEVFPGLAVADAALAAQLASISRVLTVASDSILCNQGAEAGFLHWLLEGQVAVLQAGPDKSAALIDIVRPIAGISVAGAVLGRVHAITAQAVVPSRILEVPAGPLRSLIGLRPALALELMRGLSQDAMTAVSQIVDLKTRKAAQRLGHYLVSLVIDPQARTAEFRLPYPKGMLAAKLGCRQENLSRAFASLRELGVETHGGRVKLSDIPRLRVFSGVDGVPVRARKSIAEEFSSAFDL